MLEQNHYKSPIRKLVNFFEKSRDNWKEKYQLNKEENKKLKTKICTLKASQQKWKSETLLLRKQLKQAAINTENIIPETAKKKQSMGSSLSLLYLNNQWGQVFHYYIYDR
jgi:hypothetical protein